jgi:hypothetical protein
MFQARFNRISTIMSLSALAAGLLIGFIAVTLPDTSNENASDRRTAEDK